MILAGDIGGTKTLLGLFQPHGARPEPIEIQAFPTDDYPGLVRIIEAFYAAQRVRPVVQAAAFGLAGPVIGQTATMTNVAWRVDAAEVASAFGFPRVALLNDLEAMAYAVPVLEGAELHTLQAGAPVRGGNMGVIAAGTGLGASLLHHTGGRYIPVPSEFGHSDFAARTEREIDFLWFARERFGRAEIEHVLSGPGLATLWEFTHRHGPCTALKKADEVPEPAQVSQAAMERECVRCVEALDLFVESYGAVAGNLALIAVTTGGMFIGGGIAPRILPALASGRFVRAFNDKGRMRSLLERVPVHVILNADAGLLGAAVYASAATAG